MRLILACLAVLSLEGCSTTGSTDFATFLQQVASDPKCGHTDRVQGNLGGLTGNNLAVYLERTCPAPAGTATGSVSVPVQTGNIVLVPSTSTTPAPTPQ